MLRPACKSLQSFTLILYTYDETFPVTRTESIIEVMSLAAPSISELTLSAKPDMDFIQIWAMILGFLCAPCSDVRI
jgi:hypothetical protein